jgi:SHS2 domain-containing protein
MSAPRYRLIDHTADIGIEVAGGSLEGVLEDAGFGMFDLMADLSRVEPERSLRLELASGSLEDLLVDWLRELLYRFQTDLVLFRDFAVRMTSPLSFSAEVSGATYRPGLDELYREIKAVTYHGLSVEKKDGVWRARVIFDV